MKKILFLAIGLTFFTVSCSSDTERQEREKDDFLKTEMIDYSEVKSSAEYIKLGELYNKFLYGEIDKKYFLHSSESLVIAKNFLEKIGEYNLGGYSSPQDIVFYALIKYLEILNS